MPRTPGLSAQSFEGDPLVFRWAQGGQILVTTSQTLFLDRQGGRITQPKLLDAARQGEFTILLFPQTLKIMPSPIQEFTLSQPADRVLLSPLGDILLRTPDTQQWRAWKPESTELKEVFFPGVIGEIKGEDELVNFREDGTVHILRAHGSGWEYRETLRFPPLYWSLDPTGRFVLFQGSSLMEIWPLGEGPLKAGPSPTNKQGFLLPEGKGLIYPKDEQIMKLDLESFEEFPYP